MERQSTSNDVINSSPYIVFEMTYYKQPKHMNNSHPTKKTIQFDLRMLENTCFSTRYETKAIDEFKELNKSIKGIINNSSESS